MTNILLDTDIGGDVDDALALALILGSPELKLGGITTVYRSNAWRRDLTRNMLRVYEREDIPVYMGFDKPITGHWNPEHGPEGAEPEEGELHGTDFILEQCAADPTLTIAAIGPLTNLAAAALRAPSLLRHHPLVLMGGMVTKARPEWNILCDPEAAGIVFETFRDITMVGLDVTEQCRFTEKELERIRLHGTAKTKLLDTMIDKFIRDFGYLPVLHDPLAVSVLLWDDLMSYRDCRILVETGGVYSRGLTLDSGHGGAPVRVAVTVNAELFKERLLERICL